MNGALRSGQRLASFVIVGIVLAPVSAGAIDPHDRSCPTEVEPLVKLMLRDLPSYANRIRIRETPTRPLDYSSIVTAGRPEFEPLPLSPAGASSKGTKPDPNLRQVFITTLERQFISGKPVRLQEFHWLFLTHTVPQSRSAEDTEKTGRSSGRSQWQLALMFSRTGSYPTDQPPSPPRESSQGVVGQAIRTWLRDCEAGAVRKISSPESSTRKTHNFFRKTG